MPESDKMAALTFVTRLGDGRLDLWTPECPADWAAGNAMGRDYAAECLAYARSEGDVTMFAAVMRSITLKGVYGAVETGFCTQVGIEAADIGVIAASPDAQPTRDVV